MGNKPNGLFTARKLEKRRKRFQECSKSYVRKKYGIKKKYDPLSGSPQGRGIVLEKVQIEAKQPNSALRKCVKVQLIKNGRQITSFLPGDDASKFIEEHDEVTIQPIGGRQGRSKGDIPGVRWEVIKVNGQSLDALLKGKIEKARR